MKLFHKLDGGSIVIRSSLLYLLSALLIIILVLSIVPLLNATNVESATKYLNERGYVVLSSTEYNSLNNKLDGIKTSADAAVVNANNAVTAAENAVDAAELAAAKVDLFNSAEVFLFPEVTNVTVTLTAGNTNV